MSDFTRNTGDQEIKDGNPSKLKKLSEYGSVVASHYNDIKEIGLEERDRSRIVHLRNFNNWIKSFIIGKFIELVRDKTAYDYKIRALDIGCGKGGDLMKWQKANIGHLICADIAGASIEQCQDRYSGLKQKGKLFTAEFITADCSKVRLINLMKDPTAKVDIVSCQFALHYSFETVSQAETMIRNISESLKTGGYFVATLPDANKIQKLLETNNGKKFGNEVFRIEFPDDRPEKPSLFGDVFHFFLTGAVNCPEFLVHFSTLERICKKYGLKAVYRKPFDKVYKEGVDHQDFKSLMFRMRALESYQPGSSRSASSSSSEYDHTKEFMERFNNSSVKTLSKSEWEATCLYQAVAFKKISE